MSPKYLIKGSEKPHSHIKIKNKALARLGGKCNNPGCMWVNWEDNSLGCRDFRLLQIDHVHGGGAKERKSIGSYGIMKRVLQMEHPEIKYQLLCPNCNWLKRYHTPCERGGGVHPNTDSTGFYK